MTSYSTIGSKTDALALKHTAGSPSQDSGSDAGACFAKGTRLKMKTGWVPVENVRNGDLIWTHNNAWLPVLRAICSKISGAALGHNAGFLPVSFPSQFGHPPLSVSGNHKMALCDWVIETYFGDSMALAAAKLLEVRDPLSKWITDGISYYNIVLPQHAVINANGHLCESYFVRENDELLMDADWTAQASTAPATDAPVSAHTQAAGLCLTEREVALYLHMTNPQSALLTPTRQQDAIA